MKKKVTEEKIVSILREAEKGETPIAEICRQNAISEQTFYRWKRKYFGKSPEAIREQRKLVDENNRLKHLLAERDLEISAMKQLLEKKW